jgi:hypothetical protein
MKKEIYFKINSDYNIKEIETPVSQSNALYFIKLYWAGRTHTTSYNNTFYLYELASLIVI